MLVIVLDALALELGQTFALVLSRELMSRLEDDRRNQFGLKTKH